MTSIIISAFILTRNSIVYSIFLSKTDIPDLMQVAYTECIAIYIYIMGYITGKFDNYYLGDFKYTSKTPQFLYGLRQSYKVFSSISIVIIVVTIILIVIYFMNLKYKGSLSKEIPSSKHRGIKWIPSFIRNSSEIFISLSVIFIILTAFFGSTLTDMWYSSLDMFTESWKILIPTRYIKYNMIICEILSVIIIVILNIILGMIIKIMYKHYKIEDGQIKDNTKLKNTKQIKTKGKTIKNKK